MNGARAYELKLVCEDHHFVSCHDCCLDFSFMNDDEEYTDPDSEPFPSKEEDTDTHSKPPSNHERDTARHCERFINSKPLGFVGLVRVLKRSHSPDFSECGYHVSINERIRSSYRGGTEEYRLLTIGEGARFVPGLGRGRRPIYRNINPENRPQRIDLADVAQHYCSTCSLTWLSGNDRPASRRCPTHGHAEGNTPRYILVYTDGACPGNGTPQALASLFTLRQD